MKNKFRVGVPSSKLKDWFNGTEIFATDEAEAIGIAAGYYLATGNIATVFMGSNGFANALEFITSLLIPYEILIDLVVARRCETPWHAIMGNNVKKFVKLIKYENQTSFK